MRKQFFLAMSFLLVAMPAMANQSQPASESSATAIGTQTTIIQQTPDISSSSSADQITTVGVQSNPTATGIGVGGSSSALAVGGDQYMVLDQRNFSKVYNRQFYQTGIDQSPNTMQYYGQFEENPWNVTPVMGATWRVNPKLENKVPYFRISKNVWQTRDPVSRVKVVGYSGAQGDLLAQISVIVTEEQTTADAMEIIKSEAAKIGGNIIEIIAFDAMTKPTSEGWHVGTGIGASGIIGNDEKASVSGAGGTGYGKSSITRETRPYVTARLWAGTGSAVIPFKKNGATAPKIEIKKLEEK